MEPTRNFSVHKKTVALAGNPNVGKSTVFNALTGMRRHTGNWSGKTVESACGYFSHNGRCYTAVDLPGTYSLFAHSPEEEVARDFLCFENPDCTIIVCGASSLERSLNLVLQATEITENIIVCVNMIDEAEKNGLKIDLKLLSSLLGVPVIGMNAKRKIGFNELLSETERTLSLKNKNAPLKITYSEETETAVTKLTNLFPPSTDCTINKRWLALRLLDSGDEFIKKINRFIPDINKALLSNSLREVLSEFNLSPQKVEDEFVSEIVSTAEKIYKKCVHTPPAQKNESDIKIDKIITGKYTAMPIMLLLLGLILWITIFGANIISDFISKPLFYFEDIMLKFCEKRKLPSLLYSPLILGVYRVSAWVVSVMLPPMAIFFPLFTFFEDLGLLPRIAFNTDGALKKCHACGKQALTMCMGFGCNAVGVMGCRIIDSPRERLIAMLTNSFMPCNGRFPILISIITMFFSMNTGNCLSSIWCAVLLTIFILIGILSALLASWLLSKTLLSGKPSFFTLELPPYRTPQPGKILIRSVLDRTVFVLGRAVKSAAPAGLLLWIFANVSVCGESILSVFSAFLDPVGRFMGMDGVILFAFILGLPANELVLPIILMSYMSCGTLSSAEDLSLLKSVLCSNGWTNVTAVCVILFTIMHWPCMTTLLTVKKETKSLKQTLGAFLLPTAFGAVACSLVSLITRLF